MQFIFKTLGYQTDAVESIVKVFEGQGYSDGIRHRHDLGSAKSQQVTVDEYGIPLFEAGIAYSNDEISISDQAILDNIRKMQRKWGIPESENIEKPLGRVTLDVEMETGTGKTYVYTKTIFELNKRYGWSKFIIVVPSIAIREGVAKSIKITASHFQAEYQKVLRAFVYDSKNLGEIDSFSQFSGIQVMIINSQAFSSDFKKDGKNETSRVIYSIRDEFQSRRPIEVIASNRPILILDEPQKLGKDGSKTQDNLRKYFNALFSMNFSATHETRHNLVYVLDSLDAFNQKLVKRISVKGISVGHLNGLDAYLYIESIDPTKNGPIARVELEVNHRSGIKKETHIFHPNDNLYDASNGIESYKGLFITDISAIDNTVSLSDGSILQAGETTGDVTETIKRRIQIRETILSHLEQESKLFSKGIKVLSLFFIDEVSNYRQYDESGNQILGEYGVMFEEEYRHILAERGLFYDQDYIKSISNIDVSKIHTGYFSIDKNGRFVNSTVKKKETYSDDKDAYDLILKNKELLLSYDSPVRFIFSHSALSEGWDNPNVFQICTLKHSDNNTRRRQEVGRGMRICVDQHGERQDHDKWGPLFHDINSLTVIADESYKDFVKGLQDETARDSLERNIAITIDDIRKRRIDVDGEKVLMDAKEAKVLYNYLIKNDYLNDDDRPTDTLRDSLREGTLKPLPEELSKFTPGIGGFLTALSTPSGTIPLKDGRKPVIKVNSLNDNFKRKEFTELWNEINHRYHYKVSFDSDELIGKSIIRINRELNVAPITYMVTTGTQRGDVTYEQLKNGQSFDAPKTESGQVKDASYSGVKYDLIGKVASNTGLLRRTVAKILKGMNDSKFNMFALNPEEFIEKVSRLINEEKSTVVVDHIRYDVTDKRFDNDIFTMNRPEGDFEKAYEAKKSVQDYVFPDSQIERKFAEDLDGAEEVVVYSKLPDGKGGFFIPTPMGEYTPDWAIAFDKDKVRHIFFVAETKGSMSSMNLSRIEEGKIRCVEKLFSDSDMKVKFHTVDSYSNLLDIVRGE